MPTLFEDEDVILYLLRRRRLTENGAEMVIANTSFVRCRLLGPMHVMLEDDVLIENCSFTPSKARCIEGLESGRPYVGAFRVIGCSFIDCEFDDVKVVVPPTHELLESKRRRSSAAA